MRPHYRPEDDESVRYRHRARRPKPWVVEVRYKHWRTLAWKPWHLWKRYYTRRDAEQGLRDARARYTRKPYDWEFRRCW